MGTSIDLHSRAAVTANDPNGMWGLFEGFPQQCRTALDLSRKVEAPALSNRPGLVVLTGMGGSAAGGDFVRALFDAQGGTPFVVSRDYHLPKFVGLGDLVFCCSYSGMTEETLSSYEEAKKAGAKIIAVTSGGLLKERAEADGFTVVTVPGGQPPRSALGFMLIPVVDMCVRLKLLPEQPFAEAFALLDACRNHWTIEGDDAGPKHLASALHGAIGFIYGLGSWQGLIATRWRGQINENAKNLAFANSFPELDHNEIVGWTQADRQGAGRFVVSVLQDGDESAKMKARYAVTKEIVGAKATFVDVVAPGESLLSKLLALTYFGDFVSLYLAALNEVDPSTIDSIDRLKAELEKVG